MAIPSFAPKYVDRQNVKPRILVLEVRARRTPKESPIAYLLVEREEEIRRFADGSISGATICLTYEQCDYHGTRIGKAKGYFQGSYTRLGQEDGYVSLTSGSIGWGAVFLDPDSLRGNRVGTYLMNEIVSWVGQWPDAKVLPIKLLKHQADEENRARRNRFYTQFGIDFGSDDPIEAESKEMLVSALKTVETWKENIRELTVPEYLESLQVEAQHVREILSDLRISAARAAAQLGLAKSKPIRWMLRHLWG